MSRERELLQTALGILEDYEWGYGGDHHKSPEASILNDIRKLLAQPEQKPLSDIDFIMLWCKTGQAKPQLKRLNLYGKAIEKHHGIGI